MAAGSEGGTPRHKHEGECVDSDGYSWHSGGDRCDCCGYGVDGGHGEPAGTRDVTPSECSKVAGAGGAEGIVALAIEYVKVHDECRVAREEWSGDSASAPKWDRLRAAEAALRAAADKLRGSVRHVVSADGDVREENERLRGQVSTLRREITIMRLSAEQRNKELDTLHRVWCDGGCKSGTHRYCGSPDDITEEVVALAERHVKRLRTWFESYKAKAGRRVRPDSVSGAKEKL